MAERFTRLRLEQSLDPHGPDEVVLAVLDHIEGAQATFGALFQGAVTQTGQIDLQMAYPGLEPHSFFATVEQDGAELTVDWRWSGFLTPPDFRRIATTLQSP